MSVPPRIEFRIDRLVVHGAGRHEARAIERDLRARLEELAHAWRETPASAPAEARIAGGQVTMPPSSSGRRPGRDAADAVVDAVAAASRARPPCTTPGPGERGAAP